MDDGNLLEKIRQYQNSIIKHSEKGNDDKILNYIKKLYDMPVTVEHLKETGIGRTMNSLRKYSGNVGVASKAIVAKWKNMVATEEDGEQQEPESRPESPVRVPSPTPPASPSPPPVSEKHKSKERKEEKHSRHHESRDKHKKHSSEKEKSERSSSKSEDRHSSKPHRKEEKKDSHKSSHREKDHKHRKHEDKHSEKYSNKYSDKHSDKYKKEDKPREKRKHEEDRTPSKKIKYEESDSEDSNRLTVDNISLSSMNSDDFLPDSTTYDSRENTQSPSEKIEKKDKHKKKEDKINGSSKKSSHKEKEKKSKDDSKPSTTKTPKSKKIILHDDNGIDSGSGASFAEALGMIEPTKKKFTPKKTSASPTPSTSTLIAKPAKSSTKPRVQSPLTQNLNLLAPNTKLEPLESIIPQLPEITTNYKPLGLNFDSSHGHVKPMSAEEALSVVISSKTQRTKVFSGNKTNWGYVPSLFQLCVRILQDNIDALEYTGGVPYEILKPVLERATANQLLNAEYYNPYLIEESDELWELHCRRECKGMQRQEMETWREMYLRCRDERDAKLKALTVNIKQSIDKSLPVRQTKLAYVDSVVKPPRGIARKQAKYGTSENLRKPLITPSQRLNSIASGSGEKISVPNPGPRAVSSSSAAVKPKKAPLMQKTLALMKGRFGRR